jgi:signal transduction histidine kinase
MNGMLERLEAAQTAQHRFVADASHELRSPLATIMARLELGRGRGPTAEDVAVMTAESHRMHRIIEDLLLLARADERGLPSRRDDVDLDELVEAEAARLRGADQLPVRLETTPVTGPSCRGRCAISSTTPSDMRTAGSTCGCGRRTIIEVEDDGPGIPAEDRLRVFERFVRLDESRDRAAGGAGLGLVAEVVATHSGSVEAVAAGERGALLRVLLPLQRGAVHIPQAEPRLPS